MEYPKFEKSNKEDNYFGKIIKDEYYNLEDTNLENTKKWICEQNKLSKKYFSNLEIKPKITKRLGELQDYKKGSIPFKIGNFYYIFKNLGLENKNILYRSKSIEFKEEEVFLNPNLWGENENLTSFSFSKSGKYFSYSISKNGSEWSEIFIIETKNKNKLDDILINTKYDSAIGYSKVIWFKDEGFFYTKFNEVENKLRHLKAPKNCKIYFHKLGNKQENDELIYEDLKNPKITFGLSNSKDEKLLYIYPSFGNHLNSLLIRFNEKNKNSNNNKIIKIFEEYKFESEIIYKNKNKIYLFTNKNSPNKKVFEIDLENYNEKNWKSILDEKEYLLESISKINNKFICKYLKNASSKILVLNEKFEFENEIKLPSIGTVFNFNFDLENEKLYFNFISFLTPSQILEYDFKNCETKVFKKSLIKFDSSKYETKQIWFESKDKTKIPMFINYKKGLDLKSKNNPVLVYAYGGFNISISPFFSIGTALFLENNGIFVVPNLRGGGEFGANWHKAGIKEKKQNVFDDFSYSIKYLIENNYTNSQKIAIMGGSNGGLLIGATIVQNPNLFKVAIPIVGVLDMLRYHKLGAGADWVYDYGCSENEKDFKYLIKYSPYHNIEEIEYPSVLILTSDTDDNVVPSHSYKFAAKLQEKNRSENEILLNVSIGSGHQGGSSTSKAIEELGIKYSFIFEKLKMEFDNNKN